MHQSHRVTIVSNAYSIAARTRRLVPSSEHGLIRYHNVPGSEFSSPPSLHAGINHFLGVGRVCFPFDTRINVSEFSRKITISVSSGCLTGLGCPDSNVPDAGRCRDPVPGAGNVQRANTATNRSGQRTFNGTRYSRIRSRVSAGSQTS